MNTIHLKEIREYIKLGCTNPMLAFTDDGKPAVIKVHYNGQGNKVLFNECFAYRLAHLLEIPTPEYFIGVIDEETLINIEFDKKNMGYCFCSAYINNTTTIIPEIIRWIDNIDSFKNIILFDHLIYNADRNNGNLIVTIKPTSRIYAIDYSHIFIDGESWDRFLLHEMMKQDMINNRILMSENSEIYQMFISGANLALTDLAALIEDKYSILSRSAFCAIIDEIPKEWIPCREDCDALLEFLCYRVEHLHEIIKQGIF